MLPRLASWLHSIRHRLRFEHDMEEELRFHVESLAADLRAQGFPETEALRRARLEFGTLEAHKQDCRQSFGLRLWDELGSDVRNGLRMLRRSPLFTAIAVISLALGIGANTAIFTMANQFLLSTLGVPDGKRLLLFTWAQGPKGRIGHVNGSFEATAGNGHRGATFPYPLYQNILRHNTVMQDTAAFKDLSGLTGVISGEAESLNAVIVSGNFYQTLGVRVEAGRGIRPEDDSPAAPAVAVISDAYWAARFGRSADVLGKTIDLNSVPLTIVGVNAPDFKGPSAGGTPQLFLPLSLQPAVMPDPNGTLLAQDNLWWLFMIGRLKPGITAQAAAAALEIDFRNALSAVPAKKDSEAPRLIMQPGSRGFDWGSHRLQKPVSLLLCLAGLILLIACANVANLLLAVAAVRQREMSLRRALGAGRARILRQVLTESLLLGTLGGAAGFFLGYLGRNFIPALFLSADTRELTPVAMDWRVFGFAVALSLATGLLFGIVPAWRSTQGNPQGSLSETDRMTHTRGKALFGKTLIVFQIALSLLLLVGAGLFLRTLAGLRHAPTGMNTERIVLFELNPPGARYSFPQRAELFQKVAEGLARLPAVEKSTSSAEALLANNSDTDCYHRHPGERGKETTTSYIGSDFFATYGIPMLNGRALDRHDLQSGQRVAVVSQSFARLFFPGSNPVGQTISGCDAGAQPMQVVGVSADAKYTDLRSPAPPTIYMPFAQSGDPSFTSLTWRTFELKTAARPESLYPQIRALLRSVDKTLPILRLRTQQQQIDETLAPERTFALLTSGFGVLALLLATVGIYGVMAYSVARRTGEIGIRMALGAERGSILQMVLREAFLLAGAGILAGLLASLASTRVIASMLFAVTPTDTATFCGAVGLLSFVALAAATVPAWRAARVDPMHALRHD